MGEQIDFKETDKEKRSQSNNILILQAVDRLEQTANMKLLEIGFGDAKHLPFLFQEAEGIHYYGIDHSEELVEKASLNHALKVKEDSALFVKIKEDGILEFQNDFFDCCFTENTINFWEDPKSYFMEINRILKPGGRFALTFIEKGFGAKLPWTQSDFTFYEVSEVKELFRKTRFSNIEVKQITGEIIGKDGPQMTKSFMVISGQK